MKKFNNISKIFKLFLFTVILFSPNIVLGLYSGLLYNLNENEIDDKSNENIPHSSYIYYEKTSEYTNDIYVSGDYAYLADTYQGLVVIDISDPTSPKNVTSETTYTFLSGIKVSGDFLYATARSTGLLVYNISDPTNPGIPIRVDTEGSAYNVFLSGDYAYVADGDRGLTIINISDPINPELVINKSMGINRVARDVYVHGDFAYVADTYAGHLGVFNISEPTNPVLLNSVDVGPSVFGIAVDGDFAYIAERSGLTIMDISDPSVPSEISHIGTDGEAFDVFVEGNWAYLASRSSGLAVINITDPTNPGSPIYADTLGDARSVFLSGDYAYVADSESGLAIIQITIPVAPGSPFYTPPPTSSDDVNGLFIDGDYAYVATKDYDLIIYNISNPINPEEVGNLTTLAGTGYDVHVSGDCAFFVTDTHLHIINVSDPTTPTPLSYMATPGYPYRLDVKGDYVYITDSTKGLVVIDISDPEHPSGPFYEDFPTPTPARYIRIEGDYAYVTYLINANNEDGLVVYDISDPTNPVSVFNLSLGNDVYGIDISGDCAFIGNYGTGLRLVNITDPTNPVIITQEGITNTACDVAVSGDYAFVSCVINGMSIVDISDLNNPNEIFHSDTSSMYANDIQVVGDYAYIANDAAGLVVFKIRERVDFETPIITGTPSDIIVEPGYTNENISWTASDTNPFNYTVTLIGNETVVNSTAWSTGVAVTYDVPTGFDFGTYIYEINFTDQYGNYQTDRVNFIVADLLNPILIANATDLVVNEGYAGQSFSWTATDDTPDTYQIELIETETIVDSDSWENNVPVVYNISNGLNAGTYTFNITLTDEFGNSISNLVSLTVKTATTGAGPSIPFGEFYAIFLTLGIISVVIFVKRKIIK